MRTLRVLNSDFTPAVDIDAYDYLYYERELYGIGTFKLIVDAQVPGAAYLQEDVIVLIDSDANKPCIIQRVYKIISPESNHIEVTGFQLKGIMNRRLTIPAIGDSHISYASQKAETVMIGYVDKTAINPTNPDRVISNLNAEANQFRGNTISDSSRYKKVDEELARLGEANQLGWDIIIDSGSMLFKLIVGTDRSYAQAINDRVAFGFKFDNARIQEYTKDATNNSNYAVVGGQGEGANRLIQEVGSTSGIARKELFVDARDLESGLDERGAQRLIENEAVVSHKISIVDSLPFRYEYEWNLGDKVTVISQQFDIEDTVRIVKVIEIYDDEGRTVSVVFERNPITLVDKINKLKSESVQVEVSDAVGDILELQQQVDGMNIDAIVIGGEAPADPVSGTYWIDES